MPNITVKGVLVATFRGSASLPQGSLFPTGAIRIPEVTIYKPHLLLSTRQQVCVELDGKKWSSPSAWVTYSGSRWDDQNTLVVQNVHINGLNWQEGEF